MEENYLSPWRVSLRLISEGNEHPGVSRRLVLWGASPLRSNFGTEVLSGLMDGCPRSVSLSTAWLSLHSGAPGSLQYWALQYCCYSLLTGMCFPGAHTLLLLRLTLWWQLPGCLSKVPFRASPRTDRRLQCYTPKSDTVWLACFSVGPWQPFSSCLSDPCQAHKFTSILEEGEREVTFHRAVGTPGDVRR